MCIVSKNIFLYLLNNNASIMSNPQIALFICSIVLGSIIFIGTLILLKFKELSFIKEFIKTRLLKVEPRN